MTHSSMPPVHESAPTGAPVPSPGGDQTAAPPRRGVLPWALGFLAYLPVPMVNVVVVGLVQLIVGLAQRKHGGLAARNGVRAANWGLTQLIWPVLLICALTIGAVTGTPAPSGGVSFHPVAEGIMFAVLGLYLLLGILQLVYAIVGTIQASGGKPVSLPVIPFLRAPKN